MFNITIINDDNLGYGVNARELHNILRVETRFNDWISRRIKESLSVEGVDYIIESFYSNLSKSTLGRPSKKYVLSLDIAKQICMLERTELGRQARLYFIECEKKYKGMKNKTKHLPSSYLDALKELVRVEEERLLLEAENTVIKQSSNTYTATQLAKDFGLSSAKALNDILYREKIQYKQGKNWIPYAGYESWYSIKEVINDEQEQSYITTRFTVEGKIQIEKLLEALGFIE